MLWRCDVEVQCSEGEREAMPYLDAVLMLKSTLSKSAFTPVTQSSWRIQRRSMPVSKASSVRWSAEAGAAPLGARLACQTGKCAAAHAETV
jgi:hypothetical protein